MARKRSTAEASMGHLRTIEIERGRGLAVLEACRKLGLTEHTDDRWKHEDGGVWVEQVKRLKSLDQEHARLTRQVADRSLDQSLVKEVAAGHGSARPDVEQRAGLGSRRARCPNAGRSCGRALSRHAAGAANSGDCGTPLWRQEGLTGPQQPPQRERLWFAKGSCLRRRPA